MHDMTQKLWIVGTTSPHHAVPLHVLKLLGCHSPRQAAATADRRLTLTADQAQLLRLWIEELSYSSDHRADLVHATLA